MIFRGWGLIARGQQRESRVDLREGLVRWRQTGSKFNGPYRLARVADGLLLRGEWTEAFSVLAEARMLTRETGEDWSDPELERLHAIAKLQHFDKVADRGEAEEALHRAIDGAREGGTRLIELRAATNLARLWGEQGRRTEAHELLSPIYGWFTEGFDTADLNEAKALLDGLK